jgi:hypothetical protein
MGFQLITLKMRRKGWLPPKWLTGKRQVTISSYHSVLEQFLLSCAATRLLHQARTFGLMASSGP